MGLVLSIAGAVVSMTGTMVTVSNDQSPAAGLIVGGALALVGTILQIEAIGHIKKAGIKLNEHGLGIVIPIK